MYLFTQHQKLVHSTSGQKHLPAAAPQRYLKSAGKQWSLKLKGSTVLKVQVFISPQCEPLSFNSALSPVTLNLTNKTKQKNCLSQKFKWPFFYLCGLLIQIGNVTNLHYSVNMCM